MILAIRNWCEGIIIAIIISIIIELLLPDGNNKKYVKVISGIYLMFIVLNPILEFIKYDISFENIFDFQEIEVSSNLDTQMKDVYIVGIEETLRSEIESLGYIVNSVNVIVDINYENIEKIELNLDKNTGKIREIEEIKIGDNTTESKIEYTEIIDFIKENYSVEGDKIRIIY